MIEPKSQARSYVEAQSDQANFEHIIGMNQFAWH